MTRVRFVVFLHERVFEMDQPLATTPSACCCCALLQQEVRALRAELACHVSCTHCGQLYDKRLAMPAAGVCAATGTTHNDPDFERCAVCQAVVPACAQQFRMSEFLDGVECVHRFHTAALHEDGLRWPCCGARGAGAVGCASLRFKVHHDVEGLAAALRGLP